VNNPDFCPKAACVGGVIDNTDSDGDGLFDCWETQGIDYDGDGVVDFQLPGANPQHRDLYVEVDYFDCTVAGGDCPAGDTHSHKPTAATINTVVQAFANAPGVVLTNPDGTAGINLHVEVDEALPHQSNCAFDQTCYAPIKITNFGTPAERANAKTRLAKRLVYRYSLWAHNQSANNSTSGISNQPSGDTLISLGLWTGQTGTTLQQAGTFMHEFGHDMGLGHGGGDGLNFKPNYMSVMNYRFQTTGRVPGNIIDYSRSVLQPLLVETSLSEPAGIGDGTFNTFWTCPNGTTGTAVGNLPINWDCKPPPDTATDLNVTGDINGDRVCLGSGADNTLETQPAGDDVVGGGTIAPGPDGTFESVIAGDDIIVGNAITAGPDGILETVPAGDDVVQNAAIWDGPNRKCETNAQGDDNPVRPAGNVEAANLSGFLDWGFNLQFDFSSLLVGFNISGVALQGGVRELDLATAQRIETQNTVADLSITQSLVRQSNGSVVLTLTARNAGFDAAIQPTINDRLPAALSLLSCTATGGGTCKVLPGDYLTVGFSGLAVGEQESATLTFCSSTAVAVSNTASIAAASTDPNPADDTSTLSLSPPNAWAPNVAYKTGNLVTFGSPPQTWQCVQAHTSEIGWEPPKVPALWSHSPPCGLAPWQTATPYTVGEEVTFNGHTYRCLQAHTSEVGWDPVSAPDLWAFVQ
jgi:uncharacterized repeat protein (TIGR01451 family)